MASRTEVTMGQPSVPDLAYFAGIIDGEGHVRLTVRNASLILCMADTLILDWVHERFSGTYSNGWVNEKNENRRPRRIWALHRAADLAFLLPQLDPFLVLKRAECAVLAEVARHSLSPNGYVHNGRSPEWHARKAELVAKGRRAFEARRV